MKFCYIVPASTYGNKKGYYDRQLGKKDHLGATLKYIYEESEGDSVLYSALLMEGPWRAYREYKRTFPFLWRGWPKIFIMPGSRKNRKHYNEADNAR